MTEVHPVLARMLLSALQPERILAGVNELLSKRRPGRCHGLWEDVASLYRLHQIMTTNRGLILAAREDRG